MRTQLIVSSVLLALLAVTVGFNVYKSDTGFDGHLSDLRAAIAAEHWGAAMDIHKRLKSDWQSRRVQFQFTKSTGTIREIDRSIARLEGHISAQSKTNAAGEVSDVMEMWEDLKR